MMDTGERVRTLLLELAPAMELAGVTQVAESGRWVLTMRDESVIFIEHMPDDDRLWLSANIAPLPDGNRQRLYEMMLIYNAQWQQTGGVRIALDAPDGNLILACDRSVSCLDQNSLGDVAAKFLSMLEAWREIVVGNRIVDKPPPESFGHDLIRV